MQRNNKRVQNHQDCLNVMANVALSYAKVIHFFLQITKSEENNCEILSIDKNKTDLMLHFICQNSPEYYWLLLTVNVLCVFANVTFIKIITIFICLVLLSFLILLKKSH